MGDCITNEGKPLPEGIKGVISWIPFARSYKQIKVLFDDFEDEVWIEKDQWMMLRQISNGFDYEAGQAIVISKTLMELEVGTEGCIEEIRNDGALGVLFDNKIVWIQTDKFSHIQLLSEYVQRHLVASALLSLKLSYSEMDEPETSCWLSPPEHANT